MLNGRQTEMPQDSIKKHSLRLYNSALYCLLSSSLPSMLVLYLFKFSRIRGNFYLIRLQWCIRKLEIVSALNLKLLIFHLNWGIKKVFMILHTIISKLYNNEIIQGIMLRREVMRLPGHATILGLLGLLDTQYPWPQFYLI